MAHQITILPDKWDQDKSNTAVSANRKDLRKAGYPDRNLIPAIVWVDKKSDIGDPPPRVHILAGGWESWDAETYTYLTKDGGKYSTASCGAKPVTKMRNLCRRYIIPVEFLRQKRFNWCKVCAEDWIRRIKARSV